MQQAVCVERIFFEGTKNKKKSAATKRHQRIHSSPATPITLRRRAAKHVPRVSPCSPASIIPGFVEIGVVQLSQSVKTTRVTHTLKDTDRQRDGRTDSDGETDKTTDRRTDGQSDRRTNYIMTHCVPPSMKRQFCQ